MFWSLPEIKETLMVCGKQNLNVYNTSNLVLRCDNSLAVFSGILIGLWMRIVVFITANTTLAAHTRPLNLTSNQKKIPEVYRTYPSSSAIILIVVVVWWSVWIVSPQRAAIWGLQHHSMTRDFLNKKAKNKEAKLEKSHFFELTVWEKISLYRYGQIKIESLRLRLKNLFLVFNPEDVAKIKDLV